MCASWQERKTAFRPIFTLTIHAIKIFLVLKGASDIKKGLRRLRKARITCYMTFHIEYPNKQYFSCVKIITVPTLSFIYTAGNLLYLKPSCWHCNDFYIRKTKQGFHDRKTEYFRENEILIGIEDACVNNGDLVWFLFSAASLRFIKG